MKTGVYANAEKAENGANAQKFVVFLEKNGFFLCFCKEKTI